MFFGKIQRLPRSLIISPREPLFSFILLTLFIYLFFLFLLCRTLTFVFSRGVPFATRATELRRPRARRALRPLARSRLPLFADVVNSTNWSCGAV